MLTSSLEAMAARDRERVMLSTIGKMCRGEVVASEVTDEPDLRQLAYLASLARNRVLKGGDALARFAAEARKLLDGKTMQQAQAPQDPLQGYFGARFPLDPGKVRSEVNLFVLDREEILAI